MILKITNPNTKEPIYILDVKEISIIKHVAIHQNKSIDGSYEEIKAVDLRYYNKEDPEESYSCYDFFEEKNRERELMRLDQIKEEEEKFNKDNVFAVKKIKNSRYPVDSCFVLQNRDYTREDSWMPGKIFNIKIDSLKNESFTFLVHKTAYVDLINDNGKKIKSL